MLFISRMCPYLPGIHSQIARPPGDPFDILQRILISFNKRFIAIGREYFLYSIEVSSVIDLHIILSISN